VPAGSNAARATGVTAAANATGAAPAFFYRRQAFRRDRLAQRVRQHIGPLADACDGLAEREPGARLLKLGRSQLRAFTPRLRRKKTGRVAKSSVARRKFFEFGAALRILESACSGSCS